MDTQKLTPEAAMKRYEELKIIIRDAEKEAEKLIPAITPFVPDDKEVQMEHGYLYIQKRPVWKYSEDIQTREASLKEDKKSEQATGAAEVTYAPTLYYKSGKPEAKTDGEL